MKYHFYILKSKLDNSYYLGSTSDLTVRLNYHNSGRSRYTKTKKPWILVYFEEFASMSLAKKREYQVKAWKSRKAIERLMAPSSNG